MSSSKYESAHAEDVEHGGKKKKNVKKAHGVDKCSYAFFGIGAITLIVGCTLAFDDHAPKPCARGSESAATSAGVNSAMVFLPFGEDQVLDLQPVGAHTALICEASDAGGNAALVRDGQSGDIDFPHGDIKCIATVGEYFTGNGMMEAVAGVPDGMGSYLLDDSTVRIIVQSESYGPVHKFESYPFSVNDGLATFTGSHVQYVDYDRTALAEFMNHSGAANSMVTGMGELVERVYNLKGELVGPRDGGSPTTAGAHFGNTDPHGNWVTSSRSNTTVPAFPSGADWTMMSLCSAHLEEPHQWGVGEGVEDLLFLTVEEWTTLVEDCDAYVGLSAHAVDIATKTMHAVGAFTLGGFEKIVEIKSGHRDYVAFAVSGYNGAFGEYDGLIAKRNAAYTRGDQMPYVKPQNIVPARVYIGRKGLNEQGEVADDFLSRNGLRYGKVYGFATNASAGWRDAWHKTHVHGDEVEGSFLPLQWQWDGQVRSFEYDGSWEFQDHPSGAPQGVEWWTATGPNAEGKKMEHCSPSLNGRSAFVQTSTAGYIGEYTMPTLASTLEALSADEHFPPALDAIYFLYQGETDVSDLIQLGGKGLRADGKDQTKMFDASDQEHSTFEDVDGFEVIAAAGGKTYGVIFEDGGNAFGERAFIAELSRDVNVPMEYKFIAQSGGSKNTRVLANVGVPAGTHGTATAHEFSGTSDLSAMLAKDANGSFRLKVGEDGFAKHSIEKDVHINDKLIVMGLQAHSLFKGAIQTLGGDRGGQWLLYQPQI